MPIVNTKYGVCERGLVKSEEFRSFHATLSWYNKSINGEKTTHITLVREITTVAFTVTPIFNIDWLKFSKNINITVGFIAFLGR